MKNFLFIVCSLFCLSFIGWETDFIKAQQIAKEQHKLILLNFSGSDWCGPCIRMKKEIFSSKEFSDVADLSLVLVNADFPRNKKNQLSKNIKKSNEELADRYNPQGKFPFTILLDANGKVIRTWDGYPENAEQFNRELKNLCNANK